MMVSGLENISRIPGEYAYIRPTGRTDAIEPVEAISAREPRYRSIYPEEALDLYSPSGIRNELKTLAAGQNFDRLA
ncbi:MAG: hypothetical protein CMN76_04755 [Spirochaetaceae bacterium]|nr:hypothetical protein [Spirochaetaceae bacterium]|tara:strand:+ start:429246 stop:429473 length:228 start_codon:yes stop_codon:yes gene_type:complete